MYKWSKSYVIKHFVKFVENRADRSYLSVSNQNVTKSSFYYFYTFRDTPCEIRKIDTSGEMYLTQLFHIHKIVYFL